MLLGRGLDAQARKNKVHEKEQVLGVYMKATRTPKQ